MPKDRDLVSTEDHEINYLLRKWGKKQSKSNRKILVERLRDFKHDPAYKPHNRQNFYIYVDDFTIKDQLENKTVKGEPLSPVAGTDVDKNGPLSPSDSTDVDKNEPLSPVRHIEADKLGEDPMDTGRTIIIGYNDTQTIRKATIIKQQSLKTSPPPPTAADIAPPKKTGRKRRILIRGLAAVIIIACLGLLFSISRFIPQINTTTAADKTPVHDEFSNTLITTHEQETDNDTPAKPDTDADVDEPGNADQYGDTLPSFEMLKEVVKDNTPLHFKANQAVLVKGENQKTTMIWQWLNRFPAVDLLIEGHTANIGRPDREMKLSIERAEHIKQILLNKVGEKLTIETKGYGATQPVIPDASSEEDKAKNRRVTITILK